VFREAPQTSLYPKPFYHAKYGLWYVQINDRQVNLGHYRDEAFRHYHTT
jgi:hypothetical protein